MRIFDHIRDSAAQLVVAPVWRCAAAAAVVVGCGMSAFADTCTDHPAIDRKGVEAVEEKPAVLLMDQHSVAELQKKIGDLVSADTHAAEAVLRVASTATQVEDQKAIGRGLGDAAANCLNFAPLDTFLIQSQVFQMGQADLLASFLEQVKDFQTAEIAGPGDAPGLGSGTLLGAPHRSTDGPPLGGFVAPYAGVAAPNTMFSRLVVGDSGSRSVVSKSP